MSSAVTLSLCMIVKNEINNIYRCLDSVEDVVDEIIIADTGSTDGTLEVVKQAAHQPLVYHWHDDFSAAKNFALEHASGDWILVLDADESLRPGSKNIIREALIRKNIIAYKIQIDNHLGGDRSGSEYVVRLFRRLPHIRYSGRVHEQITPSVMHILKSNACWQVAVLGGVIIDHYGYNRDVDDQKSRTVRNTRLLKLMLSEAADDAYVHYKLSQSLDQSPEGKRHLFTAAEIIMSCSSTQLTVHAFAPELLTKASIEWTKERNTDRALRACRVALAHFPDHPATRLACGLALLEAGQPDKAIEEIEKALSVRPSSEAFYYDKKSCDITASIALADALQRKGLKNRAMNVLQKACRTYPSNERIFHLLLKAYLDVNQPEKVLKEGLRFLRKKPTSQCLMLCADAMDMMGDRELADQWRERAKGFHYGVANDKEKQ